MPRKFNWCGIKSNSSHHKLSRSTRKAKSWTLRKVSNRISLSKPRRLTRTDTFRFLWLFCFRNHYSIPIFLRDIMYGQIISINNLQTSENAYSSINGLDTNLNKIVSPKAIGSPLQYRSVFQVNLFASPIRIGFLVERCPVSWRYGLREWAVTWNNLGFL